MENKCFWVVMFVLLVFIFVGCISIEFMGLFWLGDDGEIFYDEKFVFVFCGLGLVYIFDFRDCEYQQYVMVELGY